MPQMNSWASEPKARPMKVLAKVIEETFGYTTRIEKGYCNTDTKPRGLRYITRKGKGRTGLHLKVFRLLEPGEEAPKYQRDWLCPEGMVKCFDHNNAETYRNLGEVEEWIRKEEERRGLPSSNYGLTEYQLTLLRRVFDARELAAVSDEAIAAYKVLAGRGLVEISSSNSVRTTRVGDRFVEFKLPSPRGGRSSPHEPP
jgi:hypothetical protein